MHLGLSLAPRLENRLEQRVMSPEPHSPIRTPEITKEAIARAIPLCDITPSSAPKDKILAAEYAVYRRLGVHHWEEYLDTPFVVHADAALTLSKRYDTVVGILSAGTNYTPIMSHMGLPTYKIDFSHHRRKMEKPEIDAGSLESLKDSKGVLLVDVDVVTGRTLREVYQFLTSHGVPVDGAYIGLSSWPGMRIDGMPCLGKKTGGFRGIWTQSSHGLRSMIRTPKVEKIIPAGLRIYGPNGDLCLGRTTTKMSKVICLEEASERVITELRRQDWGMRR